MFSIGDTVYYERSDSECIMGTVVQTYVVPYVTIVDFDGKRLYAPISKVFAS